MKILDELLPDRGIIYEVGSGYGFIGIYLARSKTERDVVCIDINKDKIRQTLSTKVTTNLHGEVSDALKFTYQKCTGVVMSDFLHHVPYKIQESILKK